MRFNCAAPFRERLGRSPATAPPQPSPLQLCRPLSGAVSACAGEPTAPAEKLQLCRPLSGAVRCPAAGLVGILRRCFNCAAPFRERLVIGRRRKPAPLTGLQLCRPLSGAVSRSVSMPAARFPRRFNCAAPFRERLGPKSGPNPALTRPLQLCRPLSGAVSGPGERLGQGNRCWLQLCRPLSGAVSGMGFRRRARRFRFNCAAPFRERLAGSPPQPRPRDWRASIVPPPFGSG